MRCCFTSTKTAKIKKITISVDESTDKLKLSYIHCWGKCKMAYSHLGKQSSSPSKCSTQNQPYDPANPLLYIYPRKENKHLPKILYMNVQSSIIPKNQKVEIIHVSTYWWWINKIYSGEQELQIGGTWGNKTKKWYRG